jgi:hypothetical protein
MADYIAVTEAQSNPFAPVTSELVKQLRDNPIAIAEGAAGAPRNFLGSLERLQAGNEIRSRDDSSESFGAGANIPFGRSFSFIQHGTIRATITVTSGSGTRSVNIVRRRNNSDTIISTLSDTNGTLTADVDVIPGDTVGFTASTGVISSITFNNTRFLTAGQDLWPSVEVRLEGNRSAT